MNVEGSVEGNPLTKSVYDTIIELLNNSNAESAESAENKSVNLRSIVWEIGTRAIQNSSDQEDVTHLSNNEELGYLPMMGGIVVLIKVANARAEDAGQKGESKKDVLSGRRSYAVQSVVVSTGLCLLVA